MCDPKLKAILQSFARIFIYLTVTIGFSCQFFLICQDYFSYPTSTSVEMTMLPWTTLPSVILCFPVQNKMTGLTVKEAFASINDDSMFIRGDRRTREITIARDDNCIRRSFLRQSRYCLSFTPSQPFNFTPEELYSQEALVSANYRVIVFTHLAQRSNGKDIQAFMTPYDGDLEGIQRTPFLFFYDDSTLIQVLMMFYSSKITKLSPPPFDTDCRDYGAVTDKSNPGTRSRVTSREDCISQCLNQFTEKYGMIIESNVILREKYENSSLVLIQGDLRYNPSGVRNSSFKDQWAFCQKSCRQRDCVTESLTPAPLIGKSREIEFVERLKKLKNNMTGLEVVTIPPTDNVVIVASNAKIGLISFLTYSISCLAFWYGICPLSLGDREYHEKVLGLMSKLRNHRASLNQTRLWASNRRQRKADKNFKISSRRIQSLIILVVTITFSYQVFHTCEEYFQYPTVTFVTMDNTLPVTTIPMITVRMFLGNRDPSKASVGQSVGEYFSDRRNSSVLKLVSSRVLNEEVDKSRSQRSSVMIRTSTRSGRYYTSLLPSNSSRGYSPDELYMSKTALISFTLVPCLYAISFILSPSRGDMEGSMLPPAGFLCDRTLSDCQVSLTYTIKVTRLLGPPYDTDCRDYQTTPNTKLTSREHCFSQCLNQFTQRYGMVIIQNVISEEAFGNSSLKFIPWYFRTLRIGSKRLTRELLLKMKAKESKNPRNPFRHQVPQLFDTLISNFPSFVDNWKSCQLSCRQKDCYTEALVPKVLLKSGSGVPPLTSLSIILYPPSDQVITVTSQAKYTTLNLFVEICSCLSFWYGFSPFFMSTYLKVFKRKKLNKTPIPRAKTQRSIRSRMLTLTTFTLKYLPVLLGFCFQSIDVFDQYFKYATTTFVTMEDTAAGITSPPQVLVSFEYKGIMTWKTVKEVFSSVNDDSQVVNSTAAVDLKPFLKYGSYGLIIKTREEYSFNKNSTRERYVNNLPLYSSVLKIKNSLDYKNLHISLVPNYMDYEGIQKTPLIIRCRKIDKATCKIFLTYSAKVSKRLPPPYDTDCSDYRSMGMTSKESCFSSCLNDFTQKEGLMIESNVISKEKYGESNYVIIPSYLRTLRVNSSQLTREMISSKKLSPMFDSFQKHWMSCNQTCRQSDCVTESLVPQLMLLKSVKQSPPHHLDIQVYPPNDQVITVSSKEKLSLLDFIVYMLSCLSFWFGFCPLNLASSGFLIKKSPGSGNKI